MVILIIVVVIVTRNADNSNGILKSSAVLSSVAEKQRPATKAILNNPDSKIISNTSYQQYVNISMNDPSKKPTAIALLLKAYPSLNTSQLTQLSTEQLDEIVKLNSVNLMQNNRYPIVSMTMLNNWNEDTKNDAISILSSNAPSVPNTFWASMQNIQLSDMLGISREEVDMIDNWPHMLVNESFTNVLDNKSVGYRQNAGAVGKNIVYRKNAKGK